MIRPILDDDGRVGRKYRELVERLRSIGPAVVAFSGGVDSAFLLAASRDALGDRVRAVLGRSPSVPAELLERAERVAAALGVELDVLETRETEDPAYLANDADRCFHCKNTLFDVLERVRAAAGSAAVLDGTNADDLGDTRPGLRAGKAHGVRSPLAEAGWTKADIREASHALGLETWDRPASPCLSSRIPHGTPVTLEALERIASAERRLRALGFEEVRVRHHGAMARVEVPAERLGDLIAAREPVLDAVRGAGYAQVTVDLAGYRTGGANAGGGGAPDGGRDG